MAFHLDFGMKTKRIPLLSLHLYVGISILIALFIQLALWQHYPLHPLVSSYAKDLLVIPIVALFALRVVWLIKKDRSIRLNAFTLLSLASLYAWYFEFYLPERNSFYIADPYDTVCYFLGAVIFYILQRIEN